MVPTVHANFRCIHRGSAVWLGGGADLTPSYPFDEDCAHFHRTFRGALDAHDAALYPKWKKWCDEYFYLPHRGEMRGIGGIFFDYVVASDATLAIQRAAGDAFLPAYLPIAERRRALPFGEAERAFQLWRRGRYAEFNLLYDRGTVFGLKTGGRVESILMSMPPLARWDYAPEWPAGSPEAAALAYLQPRDWAP
jgi:coproporphyrinogen III oxidase